MIIRDATSSDFSAVMGLYRQLQPNDPILTNGEDRSVYARIMSGEGLHLFVLEDSEQVKATCYLNIIPNITRSASPYAVIENVVSDKAWRGRGFGRQIIGHALEFAWSQGCYKVMLQTGSHRESTREFYSACGFSGDDKHAFIAWQPGWKK